MPSASDAWKARLTASFAAKTDGSDIDAMVAATLSASSSRFCSGTTRATRPARSASPASIMRPVRTRSKAKAMDLVLTGRMREPLRTADPGNNAELDFRLAKLGVVRGDDEIALHGKLAAAAKRKSRDRGNHRLAGLGDAMPRSDKIAEESVGEGLAGHFLDVGAGGERLV